MSEAYTSVAVSDLEGGALEWAVGNTPEPDGMSVWQFLVDDLYSRRGFSDHHTVGLLLANAVALDPVDAFTEGGAGWWVVCLNADGDRCRYFGETPAIAIRRAVVGARIGENIDIPNKVLEHYS